jgi:6-phosphogluconolactonase
MKTIFFSSSGPTLFGSSTPGLEVRTVSRQNVVRLLAGCLTLLIVAVFLSGASAVARGTGAVFVNANAANNEVLMYQRASNGRLTLIGSFPTQGLGGSNGLGSQGGVALSDGNQFLYAVNAGSDEITAMRIKSNGLRFVGKVPSGGTFPNSIAAFGNLLYVLNSQGTSANITGFRIQSNGSLRAISNSTRPLSADLPKPAQIGFTPDGATLIVTEINTNNIDTYAVGADGRATGPTVQASAGGGPFGFAFDNAGHLVISEVGISSISSYTVSNGILQVVTGALPDFGKAACWVATTSSPTLPQQYSYITNTGSDTVSGVAIAADGGISLLDADGKTAVLAKNAFPLDMALSNDSKYLYVLEGKLPGIAAFRIQNDGGLAKIQDVTGTPVTAYGMTGY